MNDTRIVNGNHLPAINAFRSAAIPSNPLPFLFVLADCVREHGSGWIRTDEGKAVLFVLLLMGYGPTFQLDSRAEFQRLDQTVPRG